MKGYVMLKKLLYVGLVLWLGIQGSLAAVDRKEAETFMAQIGERVISLLTDKTISYDDKKSQFREILDTKFNIKAIGKFVLGRYWKRASDEQKERFLDLFETVTVASYAARFREYTSERFEVIGSRQEQDGGVTVLTQIVRPNGQIIPVDWKIFEKNGEMRIYDVILEGISMSITQRSEYASVIQQGGGQIQALIDALERKARS